MTPHLTDAELHALASGALTAEDLLRADDHLADCDRCRGRAAAMMDASGRTRDLRVQLSGQATPHLSDEELLLFVQSQLPDGAREAAVRHLDTCSTCAAQVGDLRAWTTAVPKRALWPRLAAAAAVLLLVLGSAAVWRFRSPRPTATPSSLIGLETLSTADQNRIQGALAAGVGSLPAFSSEIAPTRETLMGPAAPGENAFALLAPVGTGTVSERPLFRWQALDRADRYEVTVFDEQSTVIARSPTVTGTEWSPTEPLGRNRTYVWQVTAHRGGETITAPAPPASAARFRVIDAHAAEMLRQMEAQYTQSHLLLGLLYMENGVVDAAATHLRQVPSTDAQAALAGRSLERLSAFEPPRPAPRNRQN